MPRLPKYILLDHGSAPTFSNLGDLAMFVACLRRLQRLLPDCRMAVVHSDPGTLAQVAGEEVACIPPVVFDYLPMALSHSRMDRTVLAGRWSLPLARPLLRRSRILKRFDSAQRSAILANLKYILAARALVAVGGGYLNTEFPTVGNRILRFLDSGQRLGLPTAAFGQGIGPVDERDVGMQRLTRQVFSRLTVGALREDAFGPEWLRQLGVDPDRCRLTGDDALELAYSENSTGNREAIGVNLRLARYSGVGDALAGRIGAVIRSCDAQSAILAVPIAERTGAGDYEAVEPILTEKRKPEHTAEGIFAVIDRCRVVVTGSYHAGVFSLARGVPVVGVYANQYYEEKFRGLASVFPEYCVPLGADRPEFENALREALETFSPWSEERAAAMRSLARKRIDTAEAAYREFVSHV